ncbi:MBL fold metallo-hydrolase [Nesterenkonia ebinurensis]|uniref:MBL fold metallo-hydrolase n=1 Tax=Nesterenkonia ebinurensis TaxID=2608252 RepID=UPI00123DF969|nr:MBL fold metallo-hydrolase [Nesterenkonia ebinurensis]
MLLERIYDEDLAQASYFVGCQAKNEAVVVDARRDVTEYLDLAQRHGMKIVAVTETHIHADYLSGTRELAAATGAEVYVSGEGDEEWQYGFRGHRLHDGDVISIGNISIKARHTAGHTPEHLIFEITDGAFSDGPGYVLSGDFVFAGELGRPDLLDEAAGGVDTRYAGAKQLFDSLKNVFLAMKDHVLVYPGHGAGSACGKSLGALPATTVGYERANAWWSSYLQNDDEAGFVAQLLEGQPDAHAYFGRMKRQNKNGPEILGTLPELTELLADQVAAAVETDELIVVDTRSHQEVHSGTVLGALNIPSEKPASFGAWAYDPEQETRPLVVLAVDQTEAHRLRSHLIRVGIDRYAGFISSLDGLPVISPASITPAELVTSEAEVLLDVRNATEYAEGHIPGAQNLSAGKVLWHLDKLPKDATIISYCQSGKRNSVAASVLRRKGYRVHELEGSYNGWLAHQNR